MPLCAWIAVVAASAPPAIFGIRQEAAMTQLALPLTLEQLTTDSDENARPSSVELGHGSSGVASAEKCAWPSGIDMCNFSVITRGDAKIDGRAIWQGAAIGGNLRDGTPNVFGSFCLQHRFPDCAVTVGGSSSWQSRGPSVHPQPGVPLFSVVDFDQFVELAHRLTPYGTDDYNAEYKVYKRVRGGDFSITDVDWKGRGNGGGHKNLAVFDTFEDVHLISYPDPARRLGVSILAPRSKVIIHGLDTRNDLFVDGFIVARELVFEGNTGDLQLHGNCFEGPLKCWPSAGHTAVSTSVEASAVDDPHLISLGGEKFDIKQPGQFALLRVPLGVTERPLLRLDADVRASKDAPCGLYIKMVTLSGHWMNDKVVRIRPSGGTPGESAAGSRRQWPLSMQVAPSKGSSVGTEQWVPFGSPEENRSLVDASTRMVRALAVRREQLGPFSEGQAFRFELGEGRAPASITVSQGSHHALSVALARMAALGHPRIGGLLGTEPHDWGLELPTEECMERRARVKGEQLLLGLVDAASGDSASSLGWSGGREGSWMQAAWN